jgi:hypothetical protein
MLKKSFLSLLLISAWIIGLNTNKAFAVNPVFELKTTLATLTIDQKGNLKISQTKGLPFQVVGSVEELCKLTVKNQQTKRETILSPGVNAQISQNGQVVSLVKENIPADNTVIPVRVELSITVKEDAFCFSGFLKSNSGEWIMKDITWPDLSGIRINHKNISIYWPNSLGECFTDPALFGSKSFEYPGTSGSMAWFSVNTPENGLYVGCHDPQRGSKKFDLEYNKGTGSYRTALTFPVYSDAFDIPDVMFKIYNGSWHEGSKFYRSYFDRNFKLADISQWTKENAGLILTIFKQQNGSLMWRYSDIDKLCDIGEKLNIRLIGLWGWGVGGHDRLYPNYMPDNLMGGRQELMKAIERAHKRGFKVIVYSNGTIMDASTDYYRYNGIETMQLTERGQPNIEYYLKHRNTTPVIQVRACPGSPIWRNTIMDLALNAKSLGVDAFYIDQVGVRSPLLCFSDKHDHSLPQDAYTKYRVKMMKDIRNRMKEIDPRMSIITEGTVDALLTDIDVFHGLGPGSIITPNAYPAMFRYTFPESIIIQLNACPATSRYDANYATVFGLRHEIMCRYEADAEYLRTGKIPTRESYYDLWINDPPILSKITEAPADEVARYTHALIQFENDHAGFFRTGKFIDEVGINVNGNDILAKGFTDGNRIGVVVWNRHMSEKRDFTLSVPGYRMIKASEPGKPEVKADSPVDANSLRIIVFGKN